LNTISEIKNDNVRLKSGYLKVITFIALVTFPIMLGLLAVANNFVDVVFGEKWTEMTVLLMILAPIGMMQSIVSTAGSIYMAKGTTDLMFKIGALNAVVMVISFLVGIPFGMEGVAVAYAIANLILLYPILKVSWDQIELGVFKGLAKLAPFFFASSFMAIGVYYLGLLLETMQVIQLIILLIQVLAGIAIYFSLLMIFYRKPVINMIKDLKGGKGTPIQQSF